MLVGLEARLGERAEGGRDSEHRARIIDAVEVRVLCLERAQHVGLDLAQRLGRRLGVAESCGGRDAVLAGAQTLPDRIDLAAERGDQPQAGDDDPLAHGVPP